MLVPILEAHFATKPVRWWEMKLTEAGVPVLGKVDAILRAMWPDLPMPLTVTRPLQARMISTAHLNC